MENEFYYKKDRLNQLRGFIATVQNDCCAVKASKIIGLESATIGKQIKSLERDLGFKLFDILSNKKRIITPKGKLFYDEAVLKLQGIDGLFRNFSEKINEIDKNSIKIAGNGVVLSEIMPKYIENIYTNQNYKSSKIMLLNISKKEALEKVIKGEIDCAFYPSLKSEKISIELKKIDIFEYNNVLIIHKNHPLSNKENLSREDVEKYPYLLFDKYEFCDPKNSVNLKESNITFENATPEIMFGLINRNLGFTGMSSKLLNRYENLKHNFVIKNVDFLLPQTYYSLYVLKSMEYKNILKFFINSLKKDKDIK